MNKTKKITAVAVSLVMAGTMVATLAACTPKGGSGDGKPALDAEGNLTYSANIKLNTAIGYNKDAVTGIKYVTDCLSNESKGTGMYKYLNVGGSSSFTLFGKTYRNGNLKPAWQALSDQLKININDSWQNANSESQMSNVIGSELKLSGYNIITASASSISDEGLKGNLLNITDYLEYMPNYSAFLNRYPNARLSLTADENGAMYMLPYFDGNDDIEKYVLLRKDIVASLLDKDLSGVTTKGVTFKAQGEAKNGDDNTAGLNVVTTDYSVESFMGKTGADKYTVKVTNPAHLTGTEYKGYKTAIDNAYADGTKDGALIEVTVDYGAALTAATTSGTALYTAIETAAGTPYTGESGNIVDLQNFAIHAKGGAVYGIDLLNILREYIKVAYTSGGSPFYTNYKLSDVFNSAYAAWDVDLYVALGRCYTTCGDVINALADIPGSKIANATKYLYLLSGRRNTSQRLNDVVSMVGELYGVRGLESRYPYSYIDETGNLKDARNKAVTYEALDKMSKLVKEGLLVGGTGSKDALGSEDRGLSSTDKNAKAKTNVQTLTLHDYVQTQTAYNIGADDLDSDSSGPVLTPVSKWTVNGKVEYMRFTESWRGVKNTGWCIPKATANNPQKLSACLAFVDYFFSNDGQILMTYGPQSTKGDTLTTEATAADGGLWYGTEATDITWDEAVEQGIVKTNDGGAQYYVDPDKKDANDVLYTSKYFAYKNKLYTGTLYGKRMIPTMTTISLDMFKSDKLGNKSFTNYARYYLGTTLNIGNKDQGFEYQCTAESGIMGSKIVNIALGNGTIEHVEQHLPTLAGEGVTLTDAQKRDNWKTMTIPVLPYDPAYNTILNDTPHNWITGFNVTGTNCIFFATSDKATNLMIDVMTYGLGGGNINYADVAIPSTAQGVVTYIEGIGVGNGNNIPTIMTKIESYMQQAWLTAVKANTNTGSEE